MSSAGRGRRRRGAVYDWDRHQASAIRPVGLRFVDETLRDGLQSPSVRQPAVEEKKTVLRLSAQVGTAAVNVGYPASNPAAFSDSLSLVETVRDERLGVTPQCAARTREEDLRPIVEIAQRTGVGIEVGLFIGCSPLRLEAEGWSLDHVLSLAEGALDFAVSEGLHVLFVTEDTTRSRPDDLRRLYGLAVRHGAGRVCIADTAGFATPRAAEVLTCWVRELCDAAGGTGVGVDWHGHNDRGLAVAVALAAASSGAERVHGTALGVGERVGNAPLEQLLVNAAMLGWAAPELAVLPRYLDAAARALDVRVPEWAPVAGADAFTTATGVHAAALLKALRRGDRELLDLVYSAVPAEWLGRDQQVEVGPYSGAANVEYWLEARGYAATPELVGLALATAKQARRSLTDEELHRLAASGLRQAASQ